MGLSLLDVWGALLRPGREPLRVIALVFVLLLAAAAEAGTPRDPATVRAFRATHPCPLTGKTTGPCPGWVVDHMYPLCAGGDDAVDNMQWQTRTMSLSKDRVERELCRCKGHDPDGTPTTRR